jgi:hypothetical protein
VSVRPGLAALLSVLLLTWAPGDVSAQEAAAGTTRQAYRFSGPTVEPGHWALDAMRRANALGLLADHLPAQRAVPLEVVEAALREAAMSASGRAPALAELAESWHARLLEEHVGLASAAQPRATPVVLPGSDIPIWLGAVAGVGVESRQGAAAPGLGEFEPDRFGALPLDDRTRLVGGIDASLALGEHLGFRASPRATITGVSFEAVELSAAWGGWRAGVGRMPIGYAHGIGGGVVLTGHATLDAVGIETRTPFRLPWVLDYLGPVSFTTHFAKMTEAHHPGDPYFWSASGQFQPHRRITFGVNRAAFFGGNDPEEQSVTFQKVVDMLIGRVAGLGFEDQMVSVSARFALPTEAVVPLTAYLEWGAEDAAGAWWAVPARVIGLESVSLPFLPAVKAGVEYSHFEPSCCDNPEWYRHWSFFGSWATGDRTLGHPLGGHGREALAHASAHLLDARLRVEGRAYARSRRFQNLYSPGRTGRSNGAAAGLEWRVTPRSELYVRGAHEAGDDWAETHLRLEGRVFF